MKRPTRSRRQFAPLVLVAVFGLLAAETGTAQEPVPLPAGNSAPAHTTDSVSASPALSLFFQPMFTLPLGHSADLFTPSGAAAIGLEYGFSGRVQPYASFVFGYGYAPVRAETSVSILSCEAAGGVSFWLSPRLAMRAAAGAGYWYGFLNEGGEGSDHLTVQGGIGVQYLFSPALSLGLDLRYRSQLGLYQGMELAVSTSLAVSGREGRAQAIQQAKRQLLQGPRSPEKGRGIELTNLTLYEVFPVFHKFYDDHPVGLVTLVSKEKAPISDIKLTFMIKQYMDSPKDCPAPTELAPGTRQDVPIMSLLTDRVLEVTEATKVAADLVLDYRMEGDMYRDTRTLTLRVLDRNAMTWEDDRHAAAFVTAKDPAVLTFAKGSTGPLRGQGPEVFDSNFLTAMGLFAALDLYGLSYVVDPKTPFAEFSTSRSQIDFLQIPRQTLEYKAGDCDALSILCAALVASIGIDNPADLIEHDGVIWVPVEVTERRAGFLKAWSTGAREWREANADGTAGFLRLHEAWKEYEPVGLPGGGVEFAPPVGQALLAAFRAELGRLIDRELGPRAARLQEEARKTDSPAARNKLGVLYAQYGQLEKAEAEFRKALQPHDYLQALLNLGKLFTIREQLPQALAFYEHAAALAPKDPRVLLGFARTYHAAEQYAAAREKYLMLASVDRQLAEEYAYLGSDKSVQGAGRAGEAGALTWTPWAE
ncbi:MAG: tetratricopeptide repeat protein [Acidobacteria bacterium]|nr:tetratricopeptide repeat protein [Acidobacteriota bacterium]